MFIDEVVAKIWEQPSREYFDHYERAMKMDSQSILNALSTKRMEVVNYQNNRTKCNLLLTSGCSYRIRGKRLAGCSMCDYHTTNLDGWALMRALRKKDPVRYAQAVRKSFENVRGESTPPVYCEQVTGNDCLDPIEFPAEVFPALFGDGGLYREEPFCYMFEVLATNVKPGRLRQFQERLGREKRLFFDFGVECTSWLRQHWLNKRCTDQDIIAAVKEIQSANSFAIADVLLGIPCLTEQQSIDEFCRTMALVDQIGVDRITVLPLNRKKTTLQGVYHSALRSNKRLASLALVQDDHTGVPWLYTVIEALCAATSQVPLLARKISVAATRPDFVTGSCLTAYNVQNCPSNAALINALECFQATRDPNLLFDACRDMQNYPSYRKYLELRERQRQSGTVQNTLRIVAEEVAKTFFPNSWRARIAAFEDELVLLDD
jgi:uncharacterized Fe-S cluster-containing MiaB family protein